VRGLNILSLRFQVIESRQDTHMSPV